MYGQQQGHPGSPQPGAPPPGYPPYPSTGSQQPPPGGAPPPGYPPYPPTGSQPGYYPQPGYPQPGYPQPGYPQPAYGQPQQMQPGYPGYLPPGSAGPVHYAAQPGAVQMQPAAGRGQQMQWMARPAAIAGCPPGLEYLAQVDQLLVHQLMEILEMFTGYETCNKYRIFNSMGQQCFYAFEESDWCQRMCCGTLREFVIHITDNSNQEVMRVFRPFKCTFAGYCGCCNSCQQEVQIEAPPGVPVGYAIQQCFCCNPSFLILDATRTPVFRIEGPCTFCPRCPCDYDFNVYSYGGQGARIGKITKQWSGFVQEAFSDADNFGVSFPIDLDVRLKATLLGVLFLIDFMFFEQSGNNNNNHSSWF